MRVYLSGPIKDVTEEEATEWRTEAEEVLSKVNIKTLNPARRRYKTDPCSHLPELVEDDKIDIEMSDIVLVNFPQPSCGTSMEMLLGWQANKRVIVVSEEFTKDAWVVYHSHHIFRTFEEAYDKIIKLRSEYEHLG